MCSPPPWKIKAPSLQIVLNVSANSSFVIFDEDFTQPLVTITIPAGAFDTSNCSSSSSIILSVNPVADSVLKQVTSPSWNASSLPTMRNVLSSVIGFSLPSCGKNFSSIFFQKKSFLTRSFFFSDKFNNPFFSQSLWSLYFQQHL